MAYPVRMIIEALKASGGLVYFAAEKVGCSPATIYAMMERNPTVKEAWENEKGRLLDRSELGLKVHIADGNLTAITYYLDRQGRSRGYVKTIHEYLELTGKDGGAVKVEADLPSLLTAAHAKSRDVQENAPVNGTKETTHAVHSPDN